MDEEKYHLALMSEYMRDLLQSAEWTHIEDSNHSILRKYQTTLVSTITELADGNIIEATVITDVGDVELIMAAESTESGELVVLEHFYIPAKGANI